MTSTIPPSKGAYVPPHLRNRPISTPAASSSSSSSRYDVPATPSSRSHSSAPNSSRSQSRTPWSTSSPSSSSHPGRAHYSNTQSPRSTGYGNAFPSGSGNTTTNGLGLGHRQKPSVSSNGGSSGYSSSPSLYVYGDSFVGPFKLFREDSVRVQTFKGSSAKGLNNPNSIKQVSRDLVPLMNNLLAPPPYAYMPSAGRWIMLVFGNVDLQINYLWQLANKPLTPLSFPSSSPSQSSSAITDDEEDQDTDIIPSDPHHHTRRPSNVLATATETSATGPALGPELFVENVVKAYTAWLERDIINGPIGKRISGAKEDSIPTSDSVRRKTPPSKVLIAAALPPLVEDELLPRIPEKYVERLEEDHSKAQRAFERASSTPAPNVTLEDNANGTGTGSKTPWAKNGSPKSTNANLDQDELEVGLSTLSVSDNRTPNSPISSSSSASASSASALFDSQRTANSISTMASSIHSSTSRKEKDSSKTPISVLLNNDPPLCTLPIRVQMTNRYNTLLREYCERYPDILSFIDISPAMSTGSENPSVHGEVDRNVWACPVDPTNVHPLWEPTLPLWKDELKRHGLPTDTWRISEDAEETFSAYEADKRRRTEKRGDQRSDRIKLRDE
ncbi:uncharacterized protein IL334_005656 [Kwoniella shivajii]|uniref:Uncharacterized protein n=1 Tax=Kwoniella shivajii TaxID=564305 RepID=A0ABZ1D3R8_9TREE|nr:hypothetical protein IL334_005656 [Kwoniella shivajii]